MYRIGDASRTLAMEPHYFTIEPGAGSEGAYDHAGEEFVFVLSGCTEIWLDERERYVVGVGDCLYFPSTLPHRWRNPGPDRAELLWVNTSPTFWRESGVGCRVLVS